MVDYTIYTVTGNMPYACTCERVHITLVGTKGKSEELELRKAYKDGFEQGHTDNFSFQGMPDLGELIWVEIRLAANDLTTSYVKAWFLDRIYITMKREDKTISTWTCKYGKWLGTDADQEMSSTIPVSAYKVTKAGRRKTVTIASKKAGNKRAGTTRRIAPIAAQKKHI